jgi:hypothetical protein
MNVAVVYYIAFSIVCVVHILELLHMHFIVKNSYVGKRKIIVVFAVLSVSYLARGILNTI